MTLRASGLAVLTAPQIDETIFMPAGSKECPVWLKKLSVQTVSYPAKWFGLPRRLLWFRVQGEHPSEAVDVSKF